MKLDGGDIYSGLAALLLGRNRLGFIVDLGSVRTRGKIFCWGVIDAGSATTFAYAENVDSAGNYTSTATMTDANGRGESTKFKK